MKLLEISLILNFRNDEDANSKQGDVDDGDDEPSELGRSASAIDKEGEDRPSSSGKKIWASFVT